MSTKKFECQMTLVFQNKESQRGTEQDLRKAHIFEINETQQEAFKLNTRSKIYQSGLPRSTFIPHNVNLSGLEQNG